MLKLKVFRTFHEGIEIPKFATEQSACFDLAYSPYGKAFFEGFTESNAPFRRPLGPTGAIKLVGRERCMVPTGLIFDIPKNHSLRIHPRSGKSLKEGLVLANSEGVVDSDYFHETFLLMVNLSSVPLVINPGDRLAQAELVRCLDYAIVETKEQPSQTTDRTGGLGSTDKNKT